MTKYILTQELDSDDLPDDMVDEIKRQAVMESKISINSNGKDMRIFNHGFYAGKGFEFESLMPTFDILELIEELQDDPDTAANLIPTLEDAVLRLKSIVESWK